MTLLPLLFAVLPVLDVPEGKSVVVDAPGEYQSVSVAGELIVKAKLTSHGNVNVLPTGKLTLTDFIHFVVEDSSKFIGGESEESRSDIGLWIEGVCEITGKDVASSVEIPASEAFSDFAYGIKRAECGETVTGTNWQPSDHYRIISPDGTVSAGPWEAYGYQAGGKTFLPRVVNLTRSAGVSSGTGNHKAHVIVLHNGVLNARNAEFRDLGPKGVKGRYPIHLHRANCDCPEGRGPSSIVNCSVWSTEDPSNRGIAIHDTFGHTVSGNVFYNVQGHGVFFEQASGREYGNTVTDNITINVSGDSNGNEVVSHDDAALYNKSAHYWFRPGNTFRNNLAVGGSAIGCVVMPGKGGKRATLEDCQAWGVGLYGFQSGTPIDLKNPVAINCDVSGYASTEKYGLTDEGSVISNPLFLLNGEKPDAPFVTDTHKAYISQVYLNQSKQLTIKDGLLAGKKGVHTHYTSQVVLLETTFNVNVGFTPTYYESPITLIGGTLNTKALADAPYAPRAGNKLGMIRLKDVTWNGKAVDRTYTSEAIQRFYGLKALSYEKDPYGRITTDTRPLDHPFTAVEIPNQ